MNILCLAKEGKEIYHTMHWPLIRELDKYENFQHVREPTAEQIKKCDVVFCYTPFHYLELLKRIKKPKIAFIEDIWPPNPRGKAKHKTSHVIDKHCDCLVVRYKGNWVDGKWYKEWNRPWYYLPHCVDPKMFRNWKQKKDIGILSVGQVRHKKKYLLRRNFIEMFEDRKDFYRLDQGKALGRDFSRVINRALITGSSNAAGRIFAKTFEIPASMSLLACNFNVYMEEAGFIPDENFIEINSNNVKEKVLHYIDRPEEIKEMTLKGFRLVHERHTVQARAKEFFQYVDEFMGVSDGKKRI